MSIKERIEHHVDGRTRPGAFDFALGRRITVIGNLTDALFNKSPGLVGRNPPMDTQRKLALLAADTVADAVPDGTARQAPSNEPLDDRVGENVARPQCVHVCLGDLRPHRAPPPLCAHIRAHARETMYGGSGNRGETTGKNANHLLPLRFRRQID